MLSKRELAAKNIALTVCFTALYVVFTFLPLSQVMGLFGKYITVATVIIPAVGVILGAYIGVLCTFLGGVAALFFSPYFSLPSMVAGVITALCAGLLHGGKRLLCVLIYAVFLLVFGFYPPVGPLWLYPPLIWFQTFGLIILSSPLQSRATKGFNSNSDSKSFFAFLITSLTSTLAGQIAGSLVFEAISWPVLISDVNFYRGYWQGLTFLYPIERTLIALAAAFIGTALYKILRSTNLMPLLNNKLNNENRQKRFP